MNSARFCLVTEQDGHAFESAIAVTEAEARELLAVDTLLHEMAGWQVRSYPAFVHARRGRVVRLVRACPLDERTSAQSAGRRES